METTKTSGTIGMTGSYNANSMPQLVAIQSSIPFIHRAVEALDIVPSSCPLIVADFGASHGANSMFAMKTIIACIRQSKGEERSFLVIHNDLPSNDWSSVFNILNDDKTYFGLANGRSFYEQCLPANSLTVAYSSTSIHWLSRKPCNISNHCLSLFSRGNELLAFQSQARDDYVRFIENRSRELIIGGVLVLSILCVDEHGRSLFDGALDTLYRTAQLLPMSEEELLEYTIPMYLRSQQECLDKDLFKRCSLELIQSEFCHVESKMYDKYLQGELTLDGFAQARTDFTRSYSESALKQCLEKSERRSSEQVEQLLDRFWSIYSQQVREKPDEHNSSSYRSHLVLKKIESS